MNEQWSKEEYTALCIYYAEIQSGRTPELKDVYRKAREFLRYGQDFREIDEAIAKFQSQIKRNIEEVSTLYEAGSE